MTLSRKIGHTGVYAFSGGTVTSREKMIEALRAHESVANAYEDRPIRAIGFTEDEVRRLWSTAAPKEWNSFAEASDAASPTWAYRLADFPRAWGLTTGSGKVKVAIIDSEIDFQHPDLQRVTWLPGADFTRTGCSSLSGGADPALFGCAYGPHHPAPAPADEVEFSHGTAVAGVLAAVWNNAVGLGGAAPGVQFIPVRVLDEYGDGRQSDLAAAIRWAVDRGADVINLSLGDCKPVNDRGQIAQAGDVIDRSRCAPPTQLLKEALDYAAAKRVVMVAAAGNYCAGTECEDSHGVFTPANHPAVIAVGAHELEEPYRRSRYSSYGPGLALMAPGRVYTTMWYPNGKRAYGFAEGTSLAAPLVTGAVALMMSTGISGSDRILSALQETAAAGPPGSTTESYGAGRVQAGAAVGVPRVRVFAGERLGTGTIVRHTVMVTVANDGKFVLQRVPPGQWRVFGWLDLNNNGVLDSDDHFGELASPVAVTGGKTIHNVTFSLQRFEGPAVDVQ